MRHRTENELDVTQRRVFGRDESNVAAGDATGRTALFVRRCEDERQLRMPEDERTELAAGITAGPEHSHWNLIHTECIIMHAGEVNPEASLAGGLAQLFPGLG